MKTARPKELAEVFNGLRKKGIRIEQVALDLDVAFGTIRRWIDGSRKPKTATVKQIEQLYGVKII